MLGRTRRDFAFEATLAGRGLLPRVERMRSDGYHVHLAFLSLPSVELALARVAGRVREGAHDVPSGVVSRRFGAGLRNLFGSDLARVDTWQVLDNSQSQGPRPIAGGAWVSRMRSWMQTLGPTREIRRDEREGHRDPHTGRARRRSSADRRRHAARRPQAIEQHRKDRNPIVIWRDGAVVWIPPEDIPPLEG